MTPKRHARSTPHAPQEAESQASGALTTEFSASLTPVSWTAGGELGLTEWLLYGGRIGAIGRAAGWWIGDWLRYGNARFGERYTRASRITGYDRQTLMNMVYVASRIDEKDRRKGLSWSHHAEVVALPTHERDRWLDLADRERMSVRCLRDEIRRERRLGASCDSERELSGKQLSKSLVCPHCGASLALGDASSNAVAASAGPPTWR